MATNPLLTNDEIHGVSPRDLRALPPVRKTSPAELAAAVKRARDAQPAWEAMGFEKRAKLLKAAAKRMLERRAEAIELIRMEAGKGLAQSAMTEAVGPLDYLKNWIGVVRPFLRPQKLPISPLAFPGKKGWVEMVPRGIVALIAPWNYPVATYFKPLYPALLTGNTVIVKPSEYTPRSGLWFQQVLAEFLPKGVLEVVVGGRDLGEAVLEADIDAVVFTGSSASGRKVLEACARRMIPCNVELGGKDAAIVLEDCDLERTIAGVVQWGFQNAGQDCGAIERVYVVDAIADKFVDGLASAASRLRATGKDPTTDYDVGPLSMPRQLEIVEEHVNDAVAKGAKLRAGGKRTGEGLWFQPTVLDHCTQQMKVIADETFGPVVPVVRVKDVDDAITKANDNAFGLNASIWTGDLDKGAELGKRLQVGTVFVNNHAITGAMAFAPWTGVKESGFGIATGTHSLIYFTRPKTTVVDKSSNPDPWWLPMDAAMAEVGERLALAQLGHVAAVLKLPLLMKQRVETIRRFIRGTRPEDAANAAAPDAHADKH